MEIEVIGERIALNELEEVEDVFYASDAPGVCFVRLTDGTVLEVRIFLDKRK